MVRKTDTSDIEEECREAFRIFDKEGHGFTTRADLILNMTAALSGDKVGDRLTDKELDEMIKEADIDGDGYINYETFVKYMLQQ